MMTTVKLKQILKWTAIVLLLLLIIGMFFPTWTPRISECNSISELRKIKINGESLEVMIRGNNKENPVIIFVHGGPCCSEIPYVRKYQDLLEKNFTVVHYDQRGSGKSYKFGTDYSDVNAATHVKDLVGITEYIEQYLQQDKVILVGHSYGTYIATMAAAQKPNLYRAYVGIGQMSNTINSELDSLHKCMKAAELLGTTEEVTYLHGLEKSIAQGENITPRKYVRKYGFAARSIDENEDYFKGFIFGSEYNLLDTIRFYIGAVMYQESLIMEALNHPISDIVKEIHIPVYFIMGKFDCMTSPEAAEEYLNSLQGGEIREMEIYNHSAHYPQFEEKEKFYRWMCRSFPVY